MPSRFDATRFYINGKWVTPNSKETAPLVNPATEEEIGRVGLGNDADADRAVAAALRAFPAFATSSIKSRIDLLHAINEKLVARNEEIAYAIKQTMGAPMPLARNAQAKSGSQHFKQMIRVLETFAFETPLGSTMLRREPIGVCALISPWNWPINQIATKLAPALAAGCTMVLKPSEYTPLDAMILAEICDEAGLPEGVFNLVQGSGPAIGSALCCHRDVDMISFTGSTRAGIAISKAAAPGIKRVTLELGGKSACIILEDADLNRALPSAIRSVMLNSGQSCNASARVLVPAEQYEKACRLAADTANALTIAPDGDVGPVANARQYQSVRAYIQTGIDEGARLIAGGLEKPAGLDKGYFIRPTVFADVRPGMVIEQEEIFGPVATLTAFDSPNEAVRIANNSRYGLSGAVWSADTERAYEVASRLRTGMVHLNGAGLDSAAPFGGCKQSGNGREWGAYGLEEFLELKSIYGAD